MVYRVSGNELYHHGIPGQKWGERNGPPYPLNPEDYSESERYDRISGKVRVRYRLPKMPKDELERANRLWKSVKELRLPQGLKEAIYEAMDNNLSDDEKEMCIVTQIYKDVEYTAVNRGHNQYKIFRKSGPIDWMDEIMTEVIGDNWRDYDY